jgi:hypothetical protein
VTSCSVAVGYQRFRAPFWRWKQHGPPKRRYPTATLHGVTIQKNSTWILIITSHTKIKKDIREKGLNYTLKVKKVKVKLSPCFNWALRHEGVLGSGGIAPHILDLGTRWSEWSASRPGRFFSRKRPPDTYCIGGWVGPRASLKVVEKRNIPSPCRDSNHRSSSP